MPDPLQAVLFDLDGTLVRTKIDFPAMRSDIRQRARDVYGASELILQQSDSLDIIAETVALLPAEERESARRDLYAILEKHEEAGCAHPEPIAGATSLLSELQTRRIRVAIVTRNARSIALDLCRSMNLAAEVIIAREDTTTYKPHPDPILLACDRLGVPPRRTAMVGDLWADVAAGEAAGCATTIGIQWSYDPPGRFAKAEPTYTTATLEEAKEILLSITSQTQAVEES